jgi:signal transduction histidine kinase/ActR/RegA family two-component response regulator
MTDLADRVLVLAPIGRDGPASAELLSRSGLSPCICSSLIDLVEALRSGAAAAFVAEEALFGRDLHGLESWVDDQPTWSDLPFVVLTSHRQDPRVSGWRQKLVGSLGNVSLLERPVHPITLSSALHAAVRARHRQYEVRALIEAREEAALELQRKVEEATAELRQQIAERAHMEEALRQSQKMEAIGQLTGGVAHDFNNLLMVILAGLEMIERHRHSDRFVTFVDGMRNAAQRGASLTRQLLAFARRQPLKPEPLDLAHHVGEMRELLDRSLGSTIHLHTRFPPDLWPIEVDPAELELVILNLAFNARDAMPEGGTITISGENIPDSGHGDCVRLTVADSGTGMPPEVAARAFEPFFTTKEVGKGSGLGLAQAYGFARGSGGTVHIDSEVGCGARIVLTLPRARLPAARKSGAAEPVDLQAESGHGTVLLVEDDEEVALTVGGMLGELGYQVVRAENASNALGVLAHGPKIDLVFTDIVMPGGMDGVQLARELRARRPHLPVVLTSGHPGTAFRDIKEDQLKVLAKPYRLEELRAALMRAFHCACSHAEGRPSDRP